MSRELITYSPLVLPSDHCGILLLGHVNREKKYVVSKTLEGLSIVRLTSNSHVRQYSQAFNQGIGSISRLRLTVRACRELDSRKVVSRNFIHYPTLRTDSSSAVVVSGGPVFS